MIELDDEMREIKREIVESRALIIKTNNLTNSLLADLKTISKRQIGFEKRALWNSAVANALFVLVVIAVVKFAWDARVESIEAETRVLKDKLAKADAEMKEVHRLADERLRADGQAAAFYELIRADKKQEVIDGFEAIRKLPLSRSELLFFADSVDKIRAELSIKHYQTGLDHMRTGRWHEASLSLEESIRQKDTASHIPSARFNLARTYRKLNRQRDAIPILATLSETSPDKEIMDDAMMLLAECLIDIQAWNDAKTTLRSLLRRFPESAFANDAKLALGEISLKH